MAITEKEMMMYHAFGKNVKVICKNGQVIEGHCECYTQPLDNEPEVAEISIRRGLIGLVGITEPEIETIEYLD